MRYLTILDEDFNNYKKPAMFIGTISCLGKCCTEAGEPLCMCQNDVWRNKPVYELPDEDIIKRYMNNGLTSAIIFGGLEPIEQWTEMKNFIRAFRKVSKDDVVIYTGYNKEEIYGYIRELEPFKNIVIKFGRYVPNVEGRFDEVLGVNLVSNNQYAERIC